MSAEHGRKVWFFPDGELPARDPDPPFAPKAEAYGHESLVILNPTDRDAAIRLTFYFPAEEPVMVDGLSVAACRVRCYRMDEPVGPGLYRVPAGQYALRLESSAPVIAQIGRMDVRQANLAYYTTMGFPGGC
jgi:hypothetical protein